MTANRSRLGRRARLGATVLCVALLASACALRDSGAPPPSPTPTPTIGQPGGQSGGGAGGGSDTGEAETVPAATSALSTQGATIVDASGAPVQLKGVNWFGFDTTSCAPQGLWSLSVDAVMDQISEAGFTMVRLPWSNECVETGMPSGIDLDLNPDLQGQTTLELMDTVVAAASERGMVVLLDHQRAGGDEVQDLWYTTSYPDEQWLQDWLTLAQRYADDPTVIGADLHNEPHGPACWGCGEPALDWHAAATRAGDAIHEVAPDWLIVVSGVQKAKDGAASWWGSELSEVVDRPIDLAVPDKVVYAVHDWPASLAKQTWFDAPDYPANLPKVWEEHWAYLLTQDVAPVIVTGFGTPYQTPVDQQWLDTLVQFVDDRQIGFAYWAWNAEPETGGGLVREDWSTPNEGPRTALAPLLD